MDAKNFLKRDQDVSSLQKKLIWLLERKSIANMKKEVKGKKLAFDFFYKNTPYSLAKLFPFFSSYVLEIGSGWGEFTLESAKQNPQNFYMALEKKKKRVLRCLAKQESKQLKNIRWMVMDLEWFFDGLFCEDSFDLVVINFPDPWPKARHHKHRFFNEEFLTVLQKITKPKARLEFATDYYDYMEQVVLILENSRLWKNQHGQGVVLSKIDSRPQSYFEVLKREENENVYFIQYQKI